jgi:hypothetical protein
METGVGRTNEWRQDGLRESARGAETVIDGSTGPTDDHAGRPVGRALRIRVVKRAVMPELNQIFAQ